VGNGKARVAFALGGLGGFNAHGAGFLDAATKCGVFPELVTATSGQIVVLAKWLLGCDLRKAVINRDLEHNRFAQLAVAFGGERGVFRPAYSEALRRWWSLPDLRHPFRSFFDRVLPAEIYLPTRTQTEFAEMADAFNTKAYKNGEPVGVVFNAYNLETGEGVLFGNDHARKIWAPKKAIPTLSKAGVNGEELTHEDEPQLLPITPQAVEAALWLSLYGFDHMPTPPLMDGAYHRSCIISELHTFEHIFVARPLAPGWRKRPPSNWFQVQDWQTEMWFSASYKAEVAALEMINSLIAAKLLKRRFNSIKIHPVTPDAPAGFFHFFVERDTVYDEAYKKAVCAFTTYQDQLSRAQSEPRA
jgi:hypothetical protein